MKITIPFKNIGSYYTALRILGTVTENGAVYDGLDCWFGEVKSTGATLNTRIVRYTSTALDIDDYMDFDVYIVSNGGIRTKKPKITGHLDYTTTFVTNAYSTVELNWVNSYSDYYVQLPLEKIEVEVRFTFRSIHNNNMYYATQSGTVDLPSISIPEETITENTAVVNIGDYTNLTRFQCYKDNSLVFDRDTTNQNVSEQFLENLESNTTYLVYLDYVDGRFNGSFFTTNSDNAVVWIKTIYGYKKGKLWCRNSISEDFKKATAAYCRQNTSSSWNKSV